MKVQNWILIIILSIAVKNSCAQNLIPNPSFEIKTACPPNLTYLYYAPPWFQPSKYFGTVTNSCSSDFFSTCAGSSLSVPGVPSNIMGSQLPRTGSNYAGIGMWFTTANSREYLEVPLTTPLVAGSIYCLEYYVSLSDSSNYGISNIGAYFSSDSLIDSTYLVISYCTPQIQNPTTNILSDRSNWVLVSGSFTAIGGEKFMTIGNFNDNASSNYQFIGGSTYDRAYYYIDDINLINCDSLAGVADYNNNLLFNIFPNPNNGNMTLKYTLRQSDKGSIRLYDVTGKLVENYILNSNDQQIQIATGLDNGIYLYQILVNDRIVKRDKLLIIK